MPTKAASNKTMQIIKIRGLEGVNIVKIDGESKLELRYVLKLTRETFGRLVDVSVRTIADVESKQKKVPKLRRNYIEIKRLCDAIEEVVQKEYLGEWFDTPNPVFGKLKPIEIVERGEIDRLWEMYYRLRSGIPG